jgi:hypothetical protein
MALVRSKTEKTDSPASTALTDLVRLLARQAAREWTERKPENDEAAPSHPRSEKQP